MKRISWPTWSRRLALAAAALALTVGLWQNIRAVFEQSATYDEFHHLSAGWSYWQTGDFRLNPEHPPLTKLLAALPLRVLGTAPLEPDRFDSWRRGDSVLFQIDYYYSQPPERLAGQLAAARLVTGVFWLGLGALVVLAARRWGGTWAGVLAAVCYALEPNLGAHGFLVTNDLAAALVFTWFGLAAAGFLAGGKPAFGWNLLLAASLGPAVKFSLWILPPLAVGVCAWRWWQFERTQPLQRGLALLGGRVASLVLAGWLVLAVAYGFNLRCFSSGQVGDSLRGREEALSSPSGAIPLPRDLLVGVARLARHFREGHPAFLDGVAYRTGRWDYFPRLALYKIPVLLLAAGLAGGFLWWRRDRGDPARICLLVLPGIYLLLSLGAGLNLGLRHLLPALPFLVLFAAVGLAGLRQQCRRPAWLAVAVLVPLGLAADTLSFGPDRLAYYNRLLLPGGEPYRHFSDSNLDWGQNLLRLIPVLRSENPQKPARLMLFGFEDPHRRGFSRFEIITPQPVDMAGAPYQLRSEETEVRPGLYVLSNQAWSVYCADPAGNRLIGRFFERPPDRVVGRTLLLYRLTGQDLPRFSGIPLYVHRLQAVRRTDGTLISLE